MTRDKTAALVVIGNEILSGKVADTNSTFLTRELRQLGVTLRTIVVIPDEREVIAETIRSLRGTVDVVFTSGGVGPTHDDVTIAGVASALGREVMRHPYLESQLREFFGEDLNEARLKLTEVVEGTELLLEGNVKFPTFKVENIYVLPGIPEIFEDKVRALRSRFEVDPFYGHVIYTRDRESSIAAALDQIVAAFPDLCLGSYPTLRDVGYRVRITLESKDREYVERAFEMLMNLLPASSVVRTE